jgi:tetratricopeptide (TPR) repeat protein
MTTDRNKEEQTIINAALSRQFDQAHQLFRLRDVQGALRLLDNVLEQYPGEFPPYETMGELCIRIKDYSRAQTVLEKALSLSRPYEKCRAYRLLGYLNVEMGELDRAFVFLNKALEYDKDGYTYFHLGRAYMKRGNIEQSLNYVGMAARLLPDDAVIQETLKDLEV